jgi:ribose/xylose/arabinose/galactoside ABC-type transport system permease subunit
MGDTFTLPVIASVALGGTSLAGGKGNVLMTFVGVLIVSIVRNGMNIAGVEIFWQNVIFGVVVLFSVALTSDINSRKIMTVK